MSDEGPPGISGELLGLCLMLAIGFLIGLAVGAVAC